MIVVGLFALAFICLRMCVLLMVICIRIVLFMFVTPIMVFRPKVAAPGTKPKRAFNLVYEVVDVVNYVRNGGAQLVASGSAKKSRLTDPLEVSRNQNDTARLLVQMGYPRKFSDKIAELVARELGPNADIQQMGRRAIQIAAEEQ